MAFVIRELNHAETLGEKLRQMRLNLHKTVSEMAAVTKLSRKDLEAFERNDYTRQLEPLYAKNLLRTYVRALGGDVEYCVALFEEQRGTCDLTGPSRLPPRRTRALQFLAAHRLFRIGIGALCALALFSYMGLQVHTMLQPPTIALFEPTDGFSTSDASIMVKGQTQKEVEVFVNGQKVLPGPDGTFETEVSLERGLNVIAVEGKTRHSSTAVVYRRVVLEAAQPRSFSILSTPAQP